VRIPVTGLMSEGADMWMFSIVADLEEVSNVRRASSKDVPVVHSTKTISSQRQGRECIVVPSRGYTTSASNKSRTHPSINQDSKERQCKQSPKKQILLMAFSLLRIERHITQQRTLR
jgi:hypothetical protein